MAKYKMTAILLLLQLLLSSLVGCTPILDLSDSAIPYLDKASITFPFLQGLNISNILPYISNREADSAQVDPISLDGFYKMFQFVDTAGSSWAETEKNAVSTSLVEALSLLNIAGNLILQDQDSIVSTPFNRYFSATARDDVKNMVAAVMQ